MSEREEYVTTLERDCYVLRLRAERAERELAEARAEAERTQWLLGVRTEERDATVADLHQTRDRLDASDTTRREWEVRAAESFKVGRDVGRSTALADVTRAITELGVDVPTDALPLVMDIADMIAKADRESYATGRAAGLREAAEVLDAERPGHSKGVLNVLGAMAARMRTRALAPPAAETVKPAIGRSAFCCPKCRGREWGTGRANGPRHSWVGHCNNPGCGFTWERTPTNDARFGVTSPIGELTESIGVVAAEPRDEGES